MPSDPVYIRQSSFKNLLLYPAVSNRIMKRFTTSLTISKQRLETISKFGSNTMNILKKKRKS